jgi:hypothetical protein
MFYNLFSNFTITTGFFIGLNFLLAFNSIRYYISYLKKKKLEQENEIENNKKEKEQVLINPQIKYKDKYFESLNKLQSIDLSDDFLNNLKNSIVIENTPKGNIIMFWNNKRETFTYYSDSTIPYSILEVVARKYVITYNCKKLYINMFIELELAEKKFLELKSLKLEKQVTEPMTETNTDSIKIIPSNVFAKFKNYNKDNNKNVAISLDSSKKASNSNPKNSSVNTSIKEEKFVKERANRYSYEGKFCNFSFLQKVDKKILNKNLKITFSDFKMMK